MNDVFVVLKDLSIEYEVYDHPPVFTVEEADIYLKNVSAGKSKNIFVRNKKKTHFYLVVVESSKRINLKQLSKNLNESNLSFASSDDLLHHLGLTPGSVSPFGLIHNSDKNVGVIIDTDLMNQEKQGYHPNINTKTLILKTEDFKRYLEWTGNKVSYMEL